MASVNVNRDLSDQFYRYKMPKIVTKVEGKGNGIKTVIVNMVEVAKALDRPPMYPTKYFGCVLGAQVKCDQKNDRYIVNGAHDASKLQDLLDGFIQKYVLCPNCQNPETILGVHQKKQIITTTCQACGYCGNLPTTDRLSAYILKNPPKSAKALKGSPGIREVPTVKSPPKDDSTGAKSPSNSYSGDELEQVDPNGFEDANGSKPTEDEGDWIDDATDEAVEALDELSPFGKSLIQSDDLEKTQDERLQIFYDYMKNNAIDKYGVDESLDVSLQKEIVAEAERLEIRDKAVIVLCELLFNEKMLEQIKTHRLLLLRFTLDDKKAQKYLLRGFELLVKEFEDQLLSKVPLILKSFYDEDIIDEDVLIEWGTKKPKKSTGKVEVEILSKAAPFIKWLQEAESESEEDEPEQVELEVEYNDRMPGTKIEVEEVAKSRWEVAKNRYEVPASAPPKDDDINIDEI